MSRTGAAGTGDPGPGRADRITVMGVLNVTPDSFSDGGRWTDTAAAVAHGLRLQAEGADIVDVGGESTRPGAAPVDATEEARRVVPVVAELARAGVTVSVDTYRARVAEQAIEAGARIVNDVSGGLGDPAMAALVRARGCTWILMHGRGPSATMAGRAVYRDVLGEVCAELGQRVEAALAAGVDRARIVVDPGLGFAKTAAHNWTVLAGLSRVVGLGLPVLVGASRKSFLGALLAAPAGAGGAPRPADDREAATVAITVMSALAGAWGVRVHDVRANVDAALAAAALQTAGTAPMSTAGTAPMSTAGTAPMGTAGTAPMGTAGTAPVDLISLTGLRVRGHHGVYPDERSAGQDFVVDVELELDTTAAARSDDVADTVHYGDLAGALAAVVGGPPCHLLETLAERLLDVCLTPPLVGAATVTVHKPAAPIPVPFADVSVRVRRARRDG